MVTSTYSLDIRKVDDVATSTFYKDKLAYDNIKREYPMFYAEIDPYVSEDTISKLNDFREEVLNQTNNTKENHPPLLNFNTDQSLSIGDSNNNDAQISNLFKPLSRSQRRKLLREERLTKSIRTFSKIKKPKKTRKKLHNRVNRPINLPWIDRSLWTEIRSTRSGSLPDVQPSISREEIRNETSKCCSDFLSPSKSIRRSWISCFNFAACHAANRLGMCKFRSGNKRNLLSISRAVELTAKNTHSGLPLEMKKTNLKTISWCKKMLRNLFTNPTKGNVRSLFTKGLTFDEKGMYEKFFELPQMLFRRYQISVEDNGDLKIKPRTVWCIPQLVVALEAMFFSMALDDCKKLSETRKDYQYSIGLNNRAISDNIRSFRQSCGMYSSKALKVFSLDYSKYDRTIPIWFFNIFFAIMKQTLNMSKHSEDIYEYLRLYIKFTPMIIGGMLAFKTKGISSGLFITNMFDTLWNLTLLIITEIFFSEVPKYFDLVMNFTGNLLFKKINPNLIRESSCIDRNNKRVLGDDAIVYWSRLMVLFLEKLCFHLGMKLSIKHECDNVKTGTIFYLGRFWDKDNLPFQTFNYMAAHIVFRTKYYDIKEINFDIKDLDVMRILSICLPLKNGKEFLEKYLCNYKPLKEFMNSNKDFTLLKEWPHENYKTYKYNEIPEDVLEF